MKMCVYVTFVHRIIFQSHFGKFVTFDFQNSDISRQDGRSISGLFTGKGEGKEVVYLYGPNEKYHNIFVLSSYVDLTGFLQIRVLHMNRFRIKFNLRHCLRFLPWIVGKEKQRRCDVRSTRMRHAPIEDDV